MLYLGPVFDYTSYLYTRSSFSARMRAACLLSARAKVWILVNWNPKFKI